MEASLGPRNHVVHDFCRDLSLCRRGHRVTHGGQRWNVFCFAKEDDAKKFMDKFGGEKFDSAKRGKGRNRAEWKK